MTHKSWYTLLVVLLGGLFIFSSIGVIVAPETMIPSLLSAFPIDTEELAAYELAFLGNNIRNIVIGGFLIYFAFKNTKTVVLLLVMRLFIELFDLIGGFILNPAIMELIPVFVFTIGLEIFLIIKGMNFIKNTK